MSLVTHSKKRNRIYARAFDHDQARALYAAGLSPRALAEQYGVSEAAVRRVVDPRVAERMDAGTKRWQPEHRTPCRGGCGALLWTFGSAKNARSGLCRTCWAKSRTAEDERPGELRCSKCRKWKPDDNFTSEPGRPTRRGKRSQCRACETANRREHRARNREQQRKADNARKRRGMKMSRFVVLQKESDGRWREHAVVEAVSRMAAIERGADSEGRWAAVGAGQLAELEVEQTVAFKIARDEKAA